LKVFTLYPDNIAERVFAKPSRTEFGWLIAALTVIIVLGIMRANGIATAVDYGVFLETADGDYSGFFYAPWILPVFKVLSLLPIGISYVIWNILNVSMNWIGFRIFRGNMPIAFLTYQFAFCLFYGQIVGLLVGAVALFWWAIVSERYVAAGLLLSVAVIKPQLGLPLVITLMLITDMTWHNRIKVGLISMIPAVISLLIYPTFISDVYTAAMNQVPNDLGSISLWRYIGAWSLILWIPTVLLPLSDGRRLVAVLTTTALATPYFQQTDLLMLYTLPIGWVGIFGNVAYSMGRIGWFALRLPIIVPLIVYPWVMISHFRDQQQANNPPPISEPLAAS